MAVAGDDTTKVDEPQGAAADNGAADEPSAEAIEYKKHVANMRRVEKQLHADIKKRDALIKERDEQLARFVDVDPEELEQFLSTQKKKGEGKADDPTLAQMKRSHEAQLAELRKANEDAKRALEDAKRFRAEDAVENASLAALSGRVRNVKLAMPHLKPRLRPEEENGRVVVRPLDDKGNPIMVGPKSGTEDPARILEEYVVSNLLVEFPELAPSSGIAGGGRTGDDRSGGGGDVAYRMTKSEAERNMSKYERLRDEARKAGKRVEVIDD